MKGATFTTTFKLTYERPKVAETRRLRLHRLHTIEQLVEMLQVEMSKPENRTTTRGNKLYTKKAEQLMDDIGWAIYHHQQAKRKAQ